MNFKETETLELKRSTAELKEAVISIASMLNKHGRATLYFGIRNDGNITGQHVSEVTLRQVSQAISDHVEPRIYPHIASRKINGRDCIIIECEGRDDPYFAYGRVYMRVADADRQLSPGELKKIILKKKEYRSTWESDMSAAAINKTNAKTLRGFVKRANEAGRLNHRYDSVRGVLGKLGLIEGRNVLIANTLYLASDIERWSSGLRRVHAACADAKIKVEFKNIKTGFLVIFYRPEFAEKELKKIGGLNEGVNEGVNALFSYIRKNPGKRAPYISRVLKVPQKTIERWLKNLKIKGKIKYKGSTKTGGYEAG